MVQASDPSLSVKGEIAVSDELKFAVNGPGSAATPEIVCGEINQKDDSNSEARIPKFEQKGLVSQAMIDPTSDDGYNWRKYGQKFVKGSEFPRSYYKCTHPNCKVKKLFELTPNVQITEIIYKGTHHHPKPQPNRRLPAGSMVSALEKKSERASLLTQQEAKPTNGCSQSAQNKGRSPELHSRGANENNGEGGLNIITDDADDEDPFDKRRNIESGEINQRVDSNSEAQIPQFEQKGLLSQVIIDRTSDDGYNWRKYGQKLVKGSGFPRSYYKCTHPNCEVKKLFERTPDGQKTEIIYKGTHDHPKPQPNHRLPAGSVVSDLEQKFERAALLTQQKAKPTNMFGQSAHNNEERSPELPSCGANGNSGEGGLNIITHDADDGDPFAKSRKSGEINQREDSNIDAHIPQFEQKGLVSEVIICRTSDDGYNWRKYGQKLVKGSEFPRSYYKCTHSNCKVKKLFGRTRDGKKTEIVYKGTHDHEKPQPNRRGSMVSAFEEKSERAPLFTQPEGVADGAIGDDESDDSYLDDDDLVAAIDREIYEAGACYEGALLTTLDRQIATQRKKMLQSPISENLPTGMCTNMKKK